jgi:hypothetical protein
MATAREGEGAAMKQRLLLLSVLCALSIPVSALNPMLINGTVVPAGDFQEVVAIKMGTSGCTATIVGPRTIVTAAHCGKTGEIAKFEYKGAKYEAELTRNPLWPAKDIDVSIGVTKTDIVDAQPMNIGGVAKSGQSITLLGFGCVGTGVAPPITPKDPDQQDCDPDQEDCDPDQDDADDEDDDPYFAGVASDILRVGQSTIVSFSSFDMVSMQASGAALCFGDSGGPALMNSAGDYLVLGINSKGNIKDTNYNLRLDLPESQEFLKTVATEKSVEICGINKTCKATRVKP